MPRYMPLPWLTPPCRNLLRPLPAWVLGAALATWPGLSVAAEPADTPATPAAPAAATTNRLAQESSPYLRMHAHNPVDWYPWGEEALRKAAAENKLIFLSVGYSSCHWCHVMERESFMDAEIAAYLNKHFVCIKVDREERPDIDNIYMTAVQILSQRGGWPMSVFLTPAGKPFFGGTYFPARDGDRGTSTGFLTVIQRVQNVWTEQAEDVAKSADQLTELVKQQINAPPQSEFTWKAELIQEVQTALEGQFDSKYGGFGYDPNAPDAPKFPEPSNLEFLLNQARRHNHQVARDMLLLTLDQIAAGGIHDHLGGGFHRYSVDRRWEIPHFEKMLYDNAQLASLYAESYALTQKEEYAAAARDTVEFVLRELTSPEGAFYSALDAETDGVEGKFYRWTREELEAQLGDRYANFAAVYGTNDPPNFEGEYYVLRRSRPLAEVAEQLKLTPAALQTELDQCHTVLLAYRNQRTRPFLDTKVLTGWNGQMIRGLADAGRCLKEPRYLDAARKAARFAWSKLRNSDGRLLRTYSEGNAKLNAYVEDYAYLVEGLIALHKATGEDEWRDQALALQQQQLDHYWDDKHGGFYFTADDHEELIVRIKQFVDNVQPSGNSVSIGNLLYLSDAGQQPAFRERISGIAASASDLLNQAPGALPRFVSDLELWDGKSHGEK